MESRQPGNAKARPVRAVLFDLDGTLVEFKFDIRASRLSMISWLSKQGFDTSKMNEETKTMHIIEDAQRQCMARGIKSEHFEMLKSKLSDMLDGFEFEAFREAKPHPGSLRLLSRLHEEGILEAIITNSGRKPVDSVLDVFGFSRYVDIVITRNELAMLKPSPEGITKALAKLGVSPEEALYVGDSTIDIEAARAAGVASIAVLCGMYGLSILVASKPDYIAQNIEDVEGIALSKTKAVQEV